MKICANENVNDAAMLHKKKRHYISYILNAINKLRTNCMLCLVPMCKRRSEECFGRKKSEKFTVTK